VARWFDQLRKSRSAYLSTCFAFESVFLDTWGPVVDPSAALNALINLRQSSTVHAYAVAYRSLADSLAASGDPLSEMQQWRA
ncbi:MAG: hypothetical protein TREMPRED_001942, partial [Tremellales sp. Tagirdzhanova-0007]